MDAHHNGVVSLCLSQDNAYAISGGKDGSTSSVKLWKLSSGTCLRTFEVEDCLKSVHLSCDSAYLLSQEHNGTVRSWVLDWNLDARELTDWHADASTYLTAFVNEHTPYAAPLPDGFDEDQTIKLQLELGPSEEAIDGLTRRGRPVWGDDDLQELLFTLGCAGYGWLRPEGVKHKLEEMADHWMGPPPM